VSWVASTTGTSVTYDIQQTFDSGATYSAFLSGLTTTSTPNFSSARKFRVRAINGGGVAGPWGYQSGLTPQTEAKNLTIGSGFSTTDGTLTVVGGGGTSGASLSDATPSPLGSPAAGTSSLASRSDHVHLLPTISYTALTDVPTSFTPAAHTQAASTISDFATEAAKYGPVTSVNGATGAITIATGGTAGATLSDGTPSPLGSAAPGTSVLASRSDHVHALPTISYTALTNVPTSFTPAAHTQAASTISDFAAEVGKIGNVISVNGMTGAVTITGGGGTSGASLSDATPSALGTAAAGTSSLASRSDHVHVLPTISYTALSNVPTSFTPSAHTQAASTITGLAAVAISGSASDLQTGVLPPAQLPRATKTTLGAVSVGDGLSVLSGAISVELPPGAPSGVTDDGSGTISWTPSLTGTSVQYEVQSTADSGATYVSYSVVTIPSTVYIILGGRKFRVRAKNAVGGVSAWAYQAGLIPQVEAKNLTIGSGFSTTDGTLTAVPGSSGVTSVNGRTGSVSLSKSDVGLGSVDNTLDANKPVSTLQAAADAAVQAYAIQRTNHIGTQVASTISDFAVEVAKIGNVISVNGQTGAVTIATGGTGGSSYTLPNATTTSAGGVVVGSGLSVNSGTLSANVTSVAGRTGAVVIASSDVSGLTAVANVVSVQGRTGSVTVTSADLTAVTSITTGVTSATAVVNMVALSASAYSALATKVTNTLYIVSG
jgi:hypothetical protein